MVWCTRQAGAGASKQQERQGRIYSCTTSHQWIQKNIPNQVLSLFLNQHRSWQAGRQAGRQAGADSERRRKGCQPRGPEAPQGCRLSKAVTRWLLKGDEAGREK